MTAIRHIKHKLHELGFRRDLKDEIEDMGIELTICQLIVVVLSLISVVFLFVPLFYLQDTWFMVTFFGASFLFLIFGVWFWVHKAEICEHPEDYQRG